MSVITEDGVNLSTIEELTRENTTLYQQQTGDVDISSSNAAGELVAITSEMEARNEQLIADAFTQNTVGDAAGQNLDNIAVIKNQTRITDSKSIVYIYALGTNGIIIPAGTSFTCASNDEIFLSEYEVTIAGGEAYVSAESVNNSVECPAETIGLTTPIAGITSVTNNTDAIVGEEAETDGSLRTRLQQLGTPFTINLKEGLFLALGEIQNVKKVKILDNNTDLAIDGVPARNFSPVVLGGNDAAIADVIFKYMGVGNPSFGDITQLMKSDVTGDTYSVNFNRPLELLTVVVSTLTTNSDFNTATGFDEVKNNIIAYFDGLEIGQDLIIQKVEAVCLITGVTSATVTLDGFSVNLFSTFKELFVTNASNVTVS